MALFEATAISTVEERLTEVLADSLSLYDDNPDDDSFVRLELVQRVGGPGSRHFGDDVASVVERILQQARRRAAVLRKRHSVDDPAATAATPVGSFSLFGVGTTNLLLNSSVAFFSWQAIQEQTDTTIQEKLARLEKVEYVDDILPDWESGVRSFLETALQDKDIHESVSSDAVRLHRKWYQMTRGSGSLEYQSLQLDLLENLLQPCSLQQGASSSATLTFETALDIFADLVDRDAVKNRMRLHKIGTMIWNFVLVNPLSQQLLQIMINHDPHAVGLAKWIMGYLSPSEVVFLLSMKTHTTDNSADGGAADNDATVLERLLYAVETRSDILEEGSLSLDFLTRPQQVGLLSKACFCHSILRSALVTTRVVGFPWHHVAKINTTSVAVVAAPSVATVISALSGCYCRLIYGVLAAAAAANAHHEVPPSKNGNTLNVQRWRPCDAIVMCVEALDTIQSGCKDDGTRESSRQRVKDLQSQLQCATWNSSCDLKTWTLRLLERIHPQ